MHLATGMENFTCQAVQKLFCGASSTAKEITNKTATELSEDAITKHSPYLFSKKLPKKTICEKIFK